MDKFPRILRIVFVIILTFPVLTGCWDRQDPENMAFVVAIGVDIGPKNDYLFTFAIAVPKPLSSGGQNTSGPAKPIVVHTVEGSNIISALLASQSFIARKLTLTHAKAFILGEELAKKGVMPVLSEVVRSREFRRSFYVLTTHGSAEEYIQNIKPTTETDISLWFELELDPNNMGTMIPLNSRFHNFIIDMEKIGVGAIAIQTAFRKDILEGNDDLPSGEYDADSKQPIIGKQNAGEIRRSGETPVEFFGTAVYKKDKLRGFLNGNETKTLFMLRGEFKRTTWDFNDPANDKLNLTIDMKAQKQTVMKVKRKNNQVSVYFHITMEGDLVSVQSSADYTKEKNRKMLERALEKQMKKEATDLLDKTIHKWGVDCFFINNHVKSTFLTLKEWNDFKWQNKVKDVNYHVDITFHMRGHGDQVGPAIIGENKEK
ncbi:Ger(x)C family spore germination protein [Pseudoneobacillus sp. C159]